MGGAKKGKSNDEGKNGKGSSSQSSKGKEGKGKSKGKKNGDDQQNRTEDDEWEYRAARRYFSRLAEQSENSVGTSSGARGGSFGPISGPSLSKNTDALINNSSEAQEFVRHLQIVASKSPYDCAQILQPLKFQPVTELFRSRSFDILSSGGGENGLVCVVIPMIRALLELRNADDESFHRVLSICGKSNKAFFCLKMSIALQQFLGPDTCPKKCQRAILVHDLLQAQRRHPGGKGNKGGKNGSSTSSATWMPSSSFEIASTVFSLFIEMAHTLLIHVDSQWRAFATTLIEMTEQSVVQYLQKQNLCGDNASTISVGDDTRNKLETAEFFSHIVEVQSKVREIRRLLDIPLEDDSATGNGSSVHGSGRMNSRQLDDFLFGRKSKKEQKRGDRNGPIDRAEKAKRRFADREQRVKEADDRVARDGPGDRSQFGLRHDNDKVLIRDISIVPTLQEILCPRADFLARNDLSCEHWIDHVESERELQKILLAASSVDAGTGEDVLIEEEYSEGEEDGRGVNGGGHREGRATLIPMDAKGALKLLDTHFRLLRADCLHPVRQGLMAFLQRNGLIDISTLWNSSRFPSRFRNKSNLKSTNKQPYYFGGNQEQVPGPDLITLLQLVCPTLPRLPDLEWKGSTSAQDGSISTTDGMHSLGPHPLELQEGSELQVYRNVRFSHLYPCSKPGGRVCFVFEFENAFLQSKSHAYRKDFWERGNHLKFGSLVCLAGWVPPPNHANLTAAAAAKTGVQVPENHDFQLQMFFGVVADRNIFIQGQHHQNGGNKDKKDSLSSSALLLNKNKDGRNPHLDNIGSIGICFEEIPELAELVSIGTGGGSGKITTASQRRWWLLQSQQGFFQASRPVLEALKQMDPARLPFAKHLCSATTSAEDAVDVPRNFRGKRLDLSRLVMTDAEVKRADKVETRMKKVQKKGGKNNKGKGKGKEKGLLSDSESDDEFEVITSKLGQPRDPGDPRSRYIGAPRATTSAAAEDVNGNADEDVGGLETGDRAPVLSLEDQERKLLCEKLEKWPAEHLTDGSFPFEEVEKYCKMDATQLRGAIHLLGSDLGALQGPPGTGKTFTGVEVALLLLDNRSLIGNRPILVPTYTNHALDNFLMDLLKAGVTKICRIGSQSREPALDQYNLHELCRQTTALNYRLREQHEAAQAAEQKIQSQQKKYFYTCLSLQEAAQWILKEEGLLSDSDSGGGNNASYYDDEDEGSSNNYGRGSNNFCEDVDEDGFQTRGGQRAREQNVQKEAQRASVFFQELEKSTALGISKEHMWFYWLKSFLPVNEMNGYANQIVAGVEQTLADARKAANSKKRKNRFAALMEDDSDTDEERVDDWYLAQHWREDLVSGEYFAVDGTHGEPLLSDDLTTGGYVLWPFWAEEQGGKGGFYNTYVPVDAESERIVFQLVEELQNVGSGSGFGRIGRMVPEAMANNSFYGQNSLDAKLKKFASGDIFTKWSKKDRQDAYQKWRNCYQKHIIENLKKAITDFDNASTKLTRVSDEKKKSVLESCLVVGCTTNAAASNAAVLRGLKCQVTIVEEAGEISEAHLLATQTQDSAQLILIGDHQQLRPSTENYTLSIDNHRHAYNLDMSLFERLVVERGLPFEALQTQRRMRVEIGDLTRKLYPELEDHGSVRLHPALRGFGENLVFMDHPHREDGGGEGKKDVHALNSKTNEFEVRMVARTVEYLLQQGYDAGQLVVLTPYVGQLMKIRAVFREMKRFGVELSEKDQEAAANAGGEEEGGEEEDGTTDPTPGGEGDGNVSSGVSAPADPNVVAKVSANQVRIRIATIDNYQGEEADVVLISLVRNCGKVAPGHSSAKSLPVSFFQNFKNKVSNFFGSDSMGSCNNVGCNIGSSSSTGDPSGDNNPEFFCEEVLSADDAGSVGFLRTDNRTNVLLSRARHGMIIFGNAGMLEFHAMKRQRNGGTAGLWKPVIDELREHKRLLPGLPIFCQRHPEDGRILVQNPNDYDLYAVDGGCMRACGERLPCGHPCTRKCHPDDRNHQLGRALCTRDCTRRCPHCGEKCPKKCNQPCPERCSTIREGPFKLPCGHEIRKITCWQSRNLDTVRCRATVVSNALEPICGHKNLEVPCYVLQASPNGDLAQNLDFQCPATCDVVLKDRCEHKCQAVCCVHEAWRNEVLYPKMKFENAKAERLKRKELYDKDVAKNGYSDINVGLEIQEPKDIPTAKQLRENYPKIHPPCQQPCPKVLMCGHGCDAVCSSHKLSAKRLENGAPKLECPPCGRKCSIACAHSRCNRKCAAVCAICPEACDWECPHQGACSLPCGAPCNRLPCDKRCDKILPCGHRCPTVCGEECPKDSTWCKECEMEKSGKNLNTVVDLVMQTTLGETDLDETPLCILRCGHAFTTETLDGVCGMERAYEEAETCTTNSASTTACGEGEEKSGTESQSSENRATINSSRNRGRWTKLKPLLDKDGAGFFAVPSCPSCREPIAGVKRVGRIVKRAELDMAQRKYVLSLQPALQALQNSAKKVCAVVSEADSERRDATEPIDDIRLSGLKLSEDTARPKVVLPTFHQHFVVKKTHSSGSAGVGKGNVGRKGSGKVGGKRATSGDHADIDNHSINTEASSLPQATDFGHHFVNAFGFSVFQNACQDFLKKASDSQPVKRVRDIIDIRLVSEGTNEALVLLRPDSEARMDIELLLAHTELVCLRFLARQMREEFIRICDFVDSFGLDDESESKGTETGGSSSSTAADQSRRHLDHLLGGEKSLSDKEKKQRDAAKLAEKRFVDHFSDFWSTFLVKEFRDSVFGRIYRVWMMAREGHYTRRCKQAETQWYNTMLGYFQICAEFCGVPELRDVHVEETGGLTTGSALTFFKNDNTTDKAGVCPLRGFNTVINQDSSAAASVFLRASGVPSRKMIIQALTDFLEDATAKRDLTEAGVAEKFKALQNNMIRDGDWLRSSKDPSKRKKREPLFTKDELKNVVKAMQTEFAGTGHWYHCPNGHLYTIGECGMAMEQARCPECGSTVGGAAHQSASGNMHANAFEDTFTDTYRVR